MQIHPTRAAVDVAVIGLLGAGASLVAEAPAPLAWTGAMLLGLAIARAVTYVGVFRVRRAGFEMLWQHDERTRRLCRGEEVELQAEVRNRDSRAARYVKLRVLNSPGLSIELSPSEGEVPAQGRLAVKVRVRGERVGRHGLFGLSLEVRGGPGLFEVPLTFANPFGLEVLPRPFVTRLRSARGGRSRLARADGRSSPLAGDGMELRELREHQHGDPFKRIAWKASAKRGKLMVRDMEREERDVIWLVLDASVELWAGQMGHSPLDQGIDDVAAVAEHHLRAGNLVGLAIVSSRKLAFLTPDRGIAHAAKVMSALTHAAGTEHADRSDWDEADAASRALEHMRPLSPKSTSNVHRHELDRIARRADGLRARAPFPQAEATGKTQADTAVRSYLAAFGVYAPPRLEGERPRTDPELVKVLKQINQARPRPSLIILWSPPPKPSQQPELWHWLEQSRLQRKLRWRLISLSHGLAAHQPGSLASAVAEAVRLRSSAAESRGKKALARAGIRSESPRSLRPR